MRSRFPSKKAPIKKYTVTQNTRLWWGQYKDQLLSDVIEKDPQYVIWCISNMKEIKWNWEIAAKASKNTLKYREAMKRF